MARTSFCVLGSGSSGNCSVLLTPNPSDPERPHVSLIDLGLSPRQTRLRLHRVGVDLHDVRDVFLTHFDTDHFYPSWSRLASKYDLTLRMHRRHRGWAERSGALRTRSELFDGPVEFGHGCTAEPVMFAHDSLGTVGYRITTPGGVIGFATDLGRVPASLFDRFMGLDLLALESNYCPRMQLASNRPMFLKRRIMGGSGHLSNEESFEAVRRIDESSTLQHVVLLHLSRQCNEPDRVESLYREAPELADRLTLSTQTEPTPWLTIGPGEERPSGGGASLEPLAPAIAPTLWSDLE